MRRRHLVVLLAAALVAAVAVRMARGPAGPFQSPAPGLAEMAALPPPSPTPLPWAGSSIAAVVPDGAGQAVALLDATSGDPARRLVAGFDEIDAPAWSPTGQALAFAARRDGNWDLYAVRGDGTDARRLTDHVAFDGWPSWSPDGESLAFVSSRDGAMAIHRLTLDRRDTGTGSGAATDASVGTDTSADFDAGTDTGPSADSATNTNTGTSADSATNTNIGTDITAPAPDSTRVTRLSPVSHPGPALEPAWSPDGQWIAYAIWGDGSYRLEAVGARTGEHRVLVEAEDGLDLRSPAWSPDGSTLAYLEQRHGVGQVVAQPWSADAGALVDSSTTLVGQVASFAFFPGGGAVAITSPGRSGRRLEIRPVGSFSSRSVADLPAAASRIAWSGAPVAPSLPPIARTADRTATAGAQDPRPGLESMADVRVGGARIHAGLAEDFAALRATVRASTGVDFLGTLADAWRPLGFKSGGSAFFSWHKTGRAFDTQMELWGPGRRRDMVLVREDVGGRTLWRMFLRAGAQDGSAGRPLQEPGWTFSAGSGDESLVRTGGRRGGSVPQGYWVDFTALAARYGWQRIPSLARGNLDWRRSWTGIEYWHYERRDGLRWFEAARQVYSDAELAEQLHPDRLRSLDVPLSRLAWLGFPAGWPGGG